MSRNVLGKPIKVARGEVVGIGKVKIPKAEDFDYEIPMLSFLVIEEPGGGFVSSCLHLHVDGYGATDDSAHLDMSKNVQLFLKSNFNRLELGDAWENIRRLSRMRDESGGAIDESTVELWDAYRGVQFALAIRGVSTDSAQSLRRKMEQLQERIDQLEYENETLKGQNVLRPRWSLNPIVDYTSLMVA